MALCGRNSSLTALVFILGSCEFSDYVGKLRTNEVLGLHVISLIAYTVGNRSTPPLEFMAKSRKSYDGN